MTHLSETAVELFDLPGVDADLRAGEAYLRDGHSARTLARGAVLRMTFEVIRKGAKTGEHRANEQSSVQVVTGTVLIHLRERTVALRAGELILLPKGEYHDIEATTDAALMLHIGWRAEEPSDRV
jgi:quercetin dioxygenase-like cupin family protein